MIAKPTQPRTAEEMNEQLKTESASRAAACSVFLVICATDYEGDRVECVFLDRDKAIALRDKLNAHKRTSQQYRAEEWLDGKWTGDEI
jgi:hypothetical protein